MAIGNKHLRELGRTSPTEQLDNLLWVGLECGYKVVRGVLGVTL